MMGEWIYRMAAVYEGRCVAVGFGTTMAKANVAMQDKLPRGVSEAGCIVDLMKEPMPNDAKDLVGLLTQWTNIDEEGA